MLTGPMLINQARLIQRTIYVNIHSCCFEAELRMCVVKIAVLGKKSFVKEASQNMSLNKSYDVKDLCKIYIKVT